jgi:hypothetical protein
LQFGDTKVPAMTEKWPLGGSNTQTYPTNDELERAVFERFSALGLNAVSEAIRGAEMSTQTIGGTVERTEFTVTKRRSLAMLPQASVCCVRFLQRP